MSRSLACAALLAFAGCWLGDAAPQVTDGSSDAAFERTMAASRQQLGPKDRIKFETALTEYRAQMFARADTRQDYQRRVRQGMHGLTAQAIVAEFDRNTEQLGNEAADAIFDAKRALTK